MGKIYFMFNNYNMFFLYIKLTTIYAIFLANPNLVEAIKHGFFMISLEDCLGGGLGASDMQIEEDVIRTSGDAMR